MNQLKGLDRISEFSKKFSAISTYLGYKKFKDQNPRILAFNNEGICTLDVLRAIKKLGYPLETIGVSHLDPYNKNLLLEDYLKFHKILIQSLIEFKPDCILTMNHAAFDNIGLLTKILDQFSIPFISWFVDSPLYIFKNPNSQLSKNLFLFSWERTFLDRLSEINFENLYYLPLGTDPEIFQNPELTLQENSIFSCDVAFIGNTNYEGIQKWDLEEFHSNRLNDLCAHAVESQMSNPSKRMDKIIADLDVNNTLNEMDIEKKLTFEVYCLLQATAKHRQEVVRSLIKNYKLKIFGDSGWKNEFPDNYVKHIDYYKELPKLYKACKIVVNLTSYQMNTAVNQRIFDAPLAGGFIISDYRCDYDELFGKGVVPTYTNEADMIEKINFYLENEAERNIKSEQIKKIVLENHTYEKRIQKMFEIVKQKFNSIP